MRLSHAVEAVCVCVRGDLLILVAPKRAETKAGILSKYGDP